MRQGMLGCLPTWEGPFPTFRGTLDVTFIMPVPFKPHNLLVRPQALQYLESIRRFLQKEYPGRHEIVLAPYGPSQDGPPPDKTYRRHADLEALFRRRPAMAVNVGNAVRAAVFRSRGRSILVGNLEYQHPASFFREALRDLSRGAVAVRADRRSPESKFSIPTSLIPLLHRRQTYGVLLNRILRTLLKLETVDGLSGAYVLRRAVALRVFSRISCPGFLYEIELDLVARANRWTWKERPTHFRFEKEKPTRRVLTESAEILAWLPRFMRNMSEGKYEFLKMRGNHLFADDWGLSRGINEGILRIARLGHLKHVSIMAGTPYATYRLKELKHVRGIDLGLHFHLTLPPCSPAKVLFRWIA